MAAFPNIIAGLTRSRIHPIRRFVIDPATGTAELTPEYWLIVVRSMKREVRRMKRALNLCLFYLYVGKFVTKMKYCMLSAYRYVICNLL